MYLSLGSGSNIDAGDPPDRNAINVYNPATLVADVVRRLEAKGIDRAAIEPAMIIEAAQEQGLVPLSDEVS